MITRHALLAVPVVAMLTISGCGRTTHTVNGKVVYGDGTAFSRGGFVVIEGTVNGKPVMARGGIAKDGTFALSSRYQGDGVAAGAYRVRLVPPPSAAVDEMAKEKLPFDTKFLEFETSGLTCSVDRGSIDLVIDLGDRP